MEKYRVGIVGATGMVGQRFISLLKDHPWFEVNCVAASARSAGKTYREAVGERWAFSWEIPEKVAGMTVVDAADIDEVSKHVDFVFCAVDMKKDEIRALEEAYAKHEIPVVSNNSACRGIEDVPMVVPEINADHLAVIEAQKKRLGTAVETVKKRFEDIRVAEDEVFLADVEACQEVLAGGEHVDGRFADELFHYRFRPGVSRAMG